MEDGVYINWRDVEANKRRAKERVRKYKSQEQITKDYIFRVAIPVFVLSVVVCFVILRLFLWDILF